MRSASCPRRVELLRLEADNSAVDHETKHKVLKLLGTSPRELLNKPVGAENLHPSEKHASEATG